MALLSKSVHICLLLVILFHFVLGADLKEGFPRVYSATVPQPVSYAALNLTDSNTYFMAEVDLLQISETSVFTDASGAKFMRIDFLVHSAFELERLKGLQHHAGARNLTMNVEKTMDFHQRSRQQGRSGNRKLQKQPLTSIQGFECYKNLQGSFDWMDYMVDRAKTIPNLSIEKLDIGTSFLKRQNIFDGHSIWVLKVTGTGSGTAFDDKGIMLIMTGIHAREYAPPELASRWLEQLVDGYGADADITSTLDHTEIHVILQANPDGRASVERDSSQFRRKNMRPGGNCGAGSFGVDLNRNFPFQWGLNTGSSDDPCAETYRGSGPASEPEVQAIVAYERSIFPASQRKNDVFTPYPDTVKGLFIDIHSFLEGIIWPWGYANIETPNQSQYLSLMHKLVALNGYSLAGPGATYFGEASGASDDFVYSTLGAAAFTIEIGTAFYQDCDYFLSSILPQNIKALNYAAKISRAAFRLSQGPDIMKVSVSQEIGDSVTVEATASTSADLNGSHSPVEWNGYSITVFVDHHPDYLFDGKAPVGIALMHDYKSNKDVGTYRLGISGLSVGRHTLYVRATDSKGNEGPATAIWFEKSASEVTPAPVGPVHLTNTPIHVIVQSESPGPTPRPLRRETTAPTLPQSWSLSSIPVGNDCIDDASVTFWVVPFIFPVTCDFLNRNRQYRKYGFCREGTIGATSCPMTCGRCLTPPTQSPLPASSRPTPLRKVEPDKFEGRCIDGENVNVVRGFFLNDVDCSWLNQHYRWKRFLCRKGNPAWSDCPLACNRCVR